MWNKIFSQLNLIRFGLAITSVAVILLFLPRADHQSFSFEENQPWKYPLLTADFDTPILRDSASVRKMRDSIDRVFVPFVKRDLEAEKTNMERFANIIQNHSSHEERTLLLKLLKQTYENGVLESKMYANVVTNGNRQLRLVEGNSGESKSVVAINAASMLSPARAFGRIDSIFSHEFHGGEGKMAPEIRKALNLCITPNIVTDSATDYKYRSQEYLNVTGAMGVIKKGQRIVDRGEIINPQIFTNLNTYLDMMNSRQAETRDHTYFIIGQGLYIILIYILLYCFMSLYRSRFFSDIRQMVFLMSFITLFVVFSIVMFEYVSNGIYLVPFAAVPVIILVFFDSRTAIFALLTTVLISTLVATYQFQFLFMELSVGLTATFSIRQLSRRSQLLRTAMLSFLAYTVTYFATCLLSEGNLSNFVPRIIGIFAINSVILSFAYILILVIEKIFGFTSTVTLVELSDINSPLLRRLAENAPGTFQHSMQVSTLATEAARAIGANTTLVRTGALYHDIGKMKSPVFFTENQHGVNPHAGLNPETSAQKIIAHVTDGLAMASKEKLPKVIKAFISQHHGKGITKYFYNTAVNENPDEVIDKSKFQYPGPNPQSKETAILMMADAVEAASRSLNDFTPDAINTLVDRIIDSQISDGLLKEAPISFRDVETVKDTFKKRLSTIYHSRVQYPEINRSTASAEAESEGQ
ncbi:MAG: HDIG domain-containing protein [Muribaculaceae bacterium]|nr:HDIG domain-containing protein [Muribaculaceae bacterium]MDE6532821.1 HDIG domain-containing protein [Muribaculaceae bacterium]